MPHMPYPTSLTSQPRSPILRYRTLWLLSRAGSGGPAEVGAVRGDRPVQRAVGDPPPLFEPAALVLAEQRRVVGQQPAQRVLQRALVTTGWRGHQRSEPGQLALA